MTTTSKSTKSSAKLLGHKAQRAVAKPWVQALVRLGYAVRGLLYITIGGLALQFAMGDGGTTTNPLGAVARLSQLPFGQPLLVVIAVGLIGYSLWGFARAILDPLGYGTEPKGLLRRGGYLFSGLSYGGLALAVILFLLKQRSGLTSGTDSSIGLLSSLPGAWLVAGLGLFWILMAIGQLYTAYKADVTQELKTSEMSPNEIRVAIWAGRIGFAARGIVFGLTGLFILQTTPTDPEHVQGFDQGLGALARTPYGGVLLAVVAVGLILFGLYSILMARWHYQGSSRSA